MLPAEDQRFLKPLLACDALSTTKERYHLSTVFAGQNVGIKELADKIWLVSFMHHDLGFFDH